MQKEEKPLDSKKINDIFKSDEETMLSSPGGKNEHGVRNNSFIIY